MTENQVRSYTQYLPAAYLSADIAFSPLLQKQDFSLFVQEQTLCVLVDSKNNTSDLCKNSRETQTSDYGGVFGYSINGVLLNQLEYPSPLQSRQQDLNPTYGAFINAPYPQRSLMPLRCVKA